MAVPIFPAPSSKTWCIDDSCFQAASGESSKLATLIIEYHLPEVSAMSLVQENPLQAFHWEPQPQAERFIRGIADDFLRHNPLAADLAQRMKADTGTRFYDWIGHITLSPSDPRVGQIQTVGYGLETKT